MSLNFFSQLPEVSRFDDVVSASSYRDAPADWYLVITDVKGSTQAIEAGRYREVNALGVSSILALKNALPELELPFVFGGDGATILLPGSCLDRADRALRGVKRMAWEAFQMDLRTARVPISDLVQAGAPVRVARYRQSPHVALAAFSGRGLEVGEAWVKHPQRGAGFEVPAEGEAEADFSGFECRWSPLKSKRGVFVCLLVVALGASPSEREGTYREVIRGLGEMGCFHEHPPFSAEQLSLMGMFGNFSVEARVRSQRSSGPDFDAALSEAKKKTLIGRTLLATGASLGGFDGKAYLGEFLTNTDYRKFDEALRMVLDLRTSELSQLRSFLAERSARRALAFGTHASETAVATCIVSAYKGAHLHFLDGGSGGYALAAKELKAQLRAVTGVSQLPKPG